MDTAGPDAIAGMGEVADLDMAGKGAFRGGADNGTVCTLGRGSVLTRRWPLYVSAGACEEGAVGAG